MIKKICQTLVALSIVVLGASVVVPVGSTASAACSGAIDCATQGSHAAQTGDTPSNLSAMIKRVVNILLFVLGAVAVIVIIIGGIRYVVSGGDTGAMTGAKNTILYAVIGLVVAILAYAIVNFVLGAFAKS